MVELLKNVRINCMPNMNLWEKNDYLEVYYSPKWFNIIKPVGSNLYHIIMESLEMKILNVVWLNYPYSGVFFYYSYISDIYYTSKLLKTILFADNTCFYSHKDVKTLCETVNRELKYVRNWFKANKLSPNEIKRTNLMLLWTSFQTKNIDMSYDIYLDDCKLSRVKKK